MLGMIKKKNKLPDKKKQHQKIAKMRSSSKETKKKVEQILKATLDGENGWFLECEVKKVRR